MTPEELNESLKFLKMKKNELARMTGYKPRQISRWVNDGWPIPLSVEILVKMLCFVESIRNLGKIS